MISHLYTLRDRKVGAYGRPFADSLPKDDELETIRRAVIVDSSRAAKLADSELYYLGTFDDEKGKISLLDSPEFVGDIAKFLEALKNG